MKNTKTSEETYKEILEETKSLLDDTEKNRDHALPMAYLIAGLCGGQLLGLFANILHDSLKDFGLRYSVTVGILASLFLIWLSYEFKKRYNPLEKNLKKINKRIQVLNKYQLNNHRTTAA